MDYSFSVGTDIETLTDMSDYDVTVANYQDSWIPAMEVQAYQPASNNNQYLASYKMSPRTVSLSVIVEGTTHANLLSNLASLATIILNMNSDLYLTIDGHRAGNAYLGRFHVGGPAPPISGLAVGFDLEFICSDPFLINTTEEEQEEDTAAWDIPSSGVIGGGGEVILPTWVLKNDTGSEIEEFSFANTTRNETLAITTPLPDDSWLRITPGQSVWCEISDDDGSTWTNAMSYLGSNHTAPLLTPGVANSFTVTDGSGISVNVAYRELSY